VRETVGQAVVDGRHQRITQAVRVDVHEEAIELSARKVRHGIDRRALHAEAPHQLQVESAQSRG
jgi:hypothetical protein